MDEELEEETERIRNKSSHGRNMPVATKPIYWTTHFPLTIPPAWLGTLVSQVRIKEFKEAVSTYDPATTSQLYTRILLLWDITFFRCGDN